MDLTLARLRSLLVSKICLLGGHWLAKTQLSPSYVQIVDSSDLLGVPLGKRNHPHQTCVFPRFSIENGFPNLVQKSNIDLGTPPCALGAFVVSIHVRLNQPKLRLQQRNLRQRMLLEKHLQSTQCQTFELDTTPRLVGRLRCAQAKSCPLTMPLAGGLQGRFGGFSLTRFYR